MARTIRHNEEGSPGTVKQQQSRAHARKLLKEFERQYTRRNKNSHIYL